MLHLVHTFTLNNVFFDCVNYLTVCLIFFLFYKYKYIETPMFYALILSALGPFIINTFLIDWSFMPIKQNILDKLKV